MQYDWGHQINHNSTVSLFVWNNTRDSATRPFVQVQMMGITWLMSCAHLQVFDGRDKKKCVPNQGNTKLSPVESYDTHIPILYSCWIFVLVQKDSNVKKESYYRTRTLKIVWSFFITTILWFPESFVQSSFSLHHVGPPILSPMWSLKKPSESKRVYTKTEIESRNVIEFRNLTRWGHDFHSLLYATV